MGTFFNMSKGIGYIIDRMEVQSGEKVLVYCEAEKTRIGEMLASESARRGAQVIIAIGLAHTRHAQEPPEPAAEAMKVSDVVFCVTEKSMTHTTARAEAAKRGARVGLLIGIDEDYLSKFDMKLEDWALISQTNEKLFELESRSSTARITTAAGTNLQMDISGRSPLRGSSFKISEKPVKGGTYLLPDYFELPIAPIEGSAEGIIVCDGWIMGIDSLLEDPVTFTIKKGKIVVIEGGWQAKDLERLFATADKEAILLAELGIGIHHKAPKIWKVSIQDKKILGVTHIGFGRNDDIGGKIFSNTHLDCLFKGALIEFDGKVAIDKGVIKF
jgi:leucyl aminopeptidase (aminopeptidase T)